MKYYGECVMVDVVMIIYSASAYIGVVLIALFIILLIAAVIIYGASQILAKIYEEYETKKRRLKTNGVAIAYSA